MPNPWDVPPYPKRGDKTSNQTYSAVGEFMTNWELIEFSLARILSAFEGAPDAAEGLAKYGKGGIFRERLAILRGVAERYFIKVPNQESEAAFHQLTKYAEGYSGRRNDVAHGVVFPLHNLSPITQHFDQPARRMRSWGLIPPLHTIRRHNDLGLPAYVLTSKEIKNFSDDLLVIGLHLEHFRNDLLPQEKQRELRPKLPLP